jgi:hypothetical protein
VIRPERTTRLRGESAPNAESEQRSERARDSAENRSREQEKRTDKESARTNRDDTDNANKTDRRDAPFAPSFDAPTLSDSNGHTGLEVLGTAAPSCAAELSHELHPRDSLLSVRAHRAHRARQADLEALGTAAFAAIADQADTRRLTELETAAQPAQQSCTVGEHLEHSGRRPERLRSEAASDTERVRQRQRPDKQQNKDGRDAPSHTRSATAKTGHRH